MNTRLKAFGNNCGEVELTENQGSPRYSVCVYQLEYRHPPYAYRKLKAVFNSNSETEAATAFRQAIIDLHKFLS